MKRQRLYLVGLMLALLLLVGACGGGDDETGGSGTTAAETTGDTTAAEPVSGSIAFTCVWTGDEQKFFQAVIDAFEEKNPDATIKYTAGGDNIVTVLSTAVEGGNPPEMASLAQPGVVADFAKRDALQHLSQLRLNAQSPRADRKIESFGHGSIISRVEMFISRRVYRRLYRPRLRR